VLLIAVTTGAVVWGLPSCFVRRPTSSPLDTTAATTETSQYYSVFSTKLPNTTETLSEGLTQLPHMNSRSQKPCLM
jgi:hypothetical protein